MAFSAEKNIIYQARIKNFAVAMQNLREEAARLRAWYFAEINNNEFFVNTSQSTTAEVQAINDLTEDFRLLFENGVVAQGYRSGQLIPFLADKPAG